MGVLHVRPFEQQLDWVQGVLALLCMPAALHLAFKALAFQLGAPTPHHPLLTLSIPTFSLSPLILVFLLVFSGCHFSPYLQTLIPP